MEEQTEFLDQNPTFDKGGESYDKAFYSQAGHDAIERWFDPSIAEKAQFDRENFFVDKNNAFNEYMFDKANAYNTPEAQMQRMKDAGINPMLAAGGIAGAGNATATPMQGAKGSAELNPSTINPLEIGLQAAQTIGTLANAGQEAGKIFGFGKENKATIKQIEATANKAAEEADFTLWQKRQFRRTMRLMYDTAEKNLEQVEANIKVLQKTYEKLQQEKHNIASDTNLKVAETGEKLETTKNIAYKNAEEEFKKCFREIFGIQLNDSDMSMLVQGILSKNGEKIVETIVDNFSTIAKALRKEAGEAGKPIIKKVTEATTDANERFKNWVNNRKETREKRKIDKAIATNWKHMGAANRAKYNNNIYNFKREVYKRKGWTTGFSGQW